MIVSDHILMWSSAQWVKGSMTHLQALRISMKFFHRWILILDEYCESLELKTFQFRNNDKK